MCRLDPPDQSDLNFIRLNEELPFQRPRNRAVEAINHY